MTRTLPRVYCASPSKRIKMWQGDLLGPHVRITSTWHNNTTFDADDQDPAACARYWEKDFQEIRACDVLLAYAEAMDKPNGTLVEIGYAISYQTPVHLVGNFDWGTWQYYPLVTLHATLRGAVAAITGDLDDPT